MRIAEVGKQAWIEVHCPHCGAACGWYAPLWKGYRSGLSWWMIAHMGGRCVLN